MMYVLHREQKLHASIDELWDFISTPHNLNKITPPEMHFEIVSDVPEKMHNGLLVQYVVRLPILGKSPWLTELKHIVEGRSFVDEQRAGPYRFWFHEHTLIQEDDGVLMVDKVQYIPPFGILGRIANALIIRPKLEEIFDHRFKKMAELYG